MSKRPPPAVTRSYREAVFYIASVKCWCDSQPEICTPCVARATIARVSGQPDAGVVKQCSCCKAFKRGDEFNPDPRYTTGLASECKECMAKRAVAQRKRRARYAEA